MVIFYLKDSTPASVAGIKFPFRNWKDICEQPYEKTARIPMSRETIVRIVVPKAKPVRLSKKKPRISQQHKRITPPMPSLSQVRIKRIN